MRWTIGKKLAAGFGLALAISTIIGSVSYRSMVTLLETAHWVTHTHEVLTKLESVNFPPERCGDRAAWLPHHRGCAVFGTV